MIPLSYFVISSLIGTITSELLRASGKRNPPATPTISKDTNMPDLFGYDILGADDDDLFGSIGADEDLLDALAISGMGNSDIVGTELIGATPARQVASNRAMLALRKRQAAQKLAAKHAAAVVQRDLNKRRRYPLGFLRTSVLAGATSNIPAAPQNLFRPERLVIPSDIAFDFSVTDIKIGNQSQFVQNVAIPGAIFSEVAIDTAVYFDTAEVGNQVTVSVTNNTANPVVFSAAALGTIAK